MKKYFLIFLFVAFKLHAQANPYILGIDEAVSSTLNNGIIAAWDFEEASGTRFDNVGSNDLLDNNTVTQLSGIVGNAAHFDSTNQEYFNIVDNTDMSTGDINWTLSIWVYMDSKFSNKSILGKWGREYWLRYTSSSDRFEWRVYDSGDVLIGQVLANNFGSPSVDTWYNIVVEHDAANNTVGIIVNDGSQDEAATTAAASDQAGDFNFGTRDAGGSTTQYWNGRIDAAHFWKRLMLAAEVESLFNSGSGKEWPF